MLENEYQYFKDHRAELVKKYRGKHVVIKGNTVIGVYGSMQEAYVETTKTEQLGTFLIQLCETEENTPPAVFHSRVYFKAPND